MYEAHLDNNLVILSYKNKTESNAACGAKLILTAT